MEKKLVFVKLANRWYVHLPDYPGETKEDRMCPCKEYLENDHCCCKLYLKEDESNKS